MCLATLFLPAGDVNGGLGFSKLRMNFARKEFAGRSQNVWSLFMIFEGELPRWSFWGDVVYSITIFGFVFLLMAMSLGYDCCMHVPIQPYLALLKCKRQSDSSNLTDYAPISIGNIGILKSNPQKIQ